ncbi:hypothetical protein PT974_09250 [Cladobotryum mycophilum]|uniref:RING-type domain-containing protein n=1 Tax=Cladobotryum mycophilum TaxID=491253 RepID=A0ABR0SGS2_9HYPO
MSLCEACDEPLVVEIDNEPDDSEIETSQVPDDLKLRCGCHYHWQCLMDEASTLCISPKCPNCNTFISTNEGGSSTASTTTVILVDYTNEGGLQQNLDILPSIKEEAYVQDNPESVPARALHIMCAEGDVEGIVELLRDVANQQAHIGSILCHQDPLSDMQSGLHVAIRNKQDEAVWLLLWLASSLPTVTFPESVHRATGLVGLGRLSMEPLDDIRNLKDSHGHTAEQLARQQPEYWSVLLNTGILAP